MSEPREDPRYLSGSEFEFSPYNTGSEGVVATTTVPKGQVWAIPVGIPLTALLVTRQTVTIDEGQTTTADLAPDAPRVDFLPDPTDGEHDSDAFLAAYFDATGDRSKETLVTGGTTVSYADFSEDPDGDYVTEIDFTDSSDNAGSKEVDIYTVARSGLVRFQKRSSGKKNTREEIQTENSLTLAFSNPDAPDSDRQVTWSSSAAGMTGIIPPKFHLDVVFYDDQWGVDLDATNADPELSIPVAQRPVGPDEDPRQLREKVRNAMKA